MKKKLFNVACCMFMMVLFNSCSKTGPAGATGATGPAGPNGAAGSSGTAGTAGTPGAPGTANVIYSAWLDVAYTADTTHSGTVIDTVGYFTNIPAAKMTAAIISSGEIKVYWNISSTTNPTVVPVPYFDGGNLINPYFFLNSSGVGTIQLYANRNLGTYTNAGLKYSQYRYILIPGGVPARSIINWNNYAEVKAYLHLVD